MAHAVLTHDLLRSLRRVVRSHAHDSPRHVVAHQHGKPSSDEDRSNCDTRAALVDRPDAALRTVPPALPRLRKERSSIRAVCVASANTALVLFLPPLATRLGDTWRTPAPILEIARR